MSAGSATPALVFKRLVTRQTIRPRSLETVATPTAPSRLGSNPCLPFVAMPTSDDVRPTRNATPRRAKNTQYDINGFCVTGGRCHRHSTQRPARTPRTRTASCSSAGMIGGDSPASHRRSRWHVHMAKPPSSAPRQASSASGDRGAQVQVQCTWPSTAMVTDGVGIPDDASPTPDSGSARHPGRVASLRTPNQTKPAGPQGRRVLSFKRARRAGLSRRSRRGPS